MSHPFKALVLCAIALLAAPIKADLVVTPESPQRVVIVIPDEAGQRLPYYADLLSRRFEQAMGRKVEVVKESAAGSPDLAFHVGPTAPCKAAVPEQATLAPHCFIVTTDGKANVFFAAHDDYAVGFGVVEFLDKVMNCRQYMPAPLGECITKTDKLVIPADLRLANKPVIASVFMSGLQAQVGESYRDVNKQMEVALQLFKSDEFHHNFYNIIPVEKYGKTHPEWYPMVNGERRVPSDLHGKQFLTGSWQPCLSNPELFKHTVDYCVKWFDDHPGATSVSIAVNDAGGPCQCDECKKLGSQWPGNWQANLYYDFANRVARELAKQKPGKMVGFIAFGIATTPPPFKIEKNVLVYKVQPDDPPGTSLKAWGDLGASTGVYTWIYGFSMVTPRYFPHKFAQILKRWISQGDQGFYAEAYPNWIIDAPMLYAVSKIARNPDVDPDVLLSQYAADMFGKQAGPAVVAFYKTAEGAMERRADQRTDEDDYTHLSGFRWRLRYQFDCWRSEDVEKMDAALAQAAPLIPADSMEAKRFELLQTWWNWSREYILAYTTAEKIHQAKITSAQEAEAILPLIAQVDQHVAGVQDQWNKHVGPPASQTPAIALQRALYLRNEMNAKSWEPLTGIYLQPRDFAVAKVDDALTASSDAMVKALGKEATIELWSKLAKDHPEAAPYFGPQAVMLRGQMHNLIENGSFEQIDPFTAADQWTVPEGYVLWNGSMNMVTEDIGVDDKVARTGSHSWRTGKGTGGSLNRTVSIVPGGRYLVSVWVRQTTNVGEARMVLKLYDKDGASPDEFQKTLEHGLEVGPWHELHIIITAAPWCDKMNIQLVAKPHDDHDVTWFDDLSVSRLY